MLKSLFNKVAGLKACNFIKKDTSTQVFSSEYCEIFKKSYFQEHLRTAASVFSTLLCNVLKNILMGSFPLYGNQSIDLQSKYIATEAFIIFSNILQSDLKKVYIWLLRTHIG